MIKKWMKWSFLEAGSRAASVTFQKVIGLVSATFSQAMLGTFVVGAIQVIAGFIMAKTRRKTFITKRSHIIGAVLFGLGAALGTILPFYTFILGADMAVRTFIVTLSIVPGALIDKMCFGRKISARQWMGVLVAMFAGYSILNWPSLEEFVKLPLWVWLSFISTAIVTINQYITQKIKDIDPFVKNFWGGLTTFVFAIIGLIICGSLDLLFEFRSMPKLWLASAMVGLIVVCMWTFNVLGYKNGAQIAIKKLVVHGSRLIMVTVIGISAFGEDLTMAKVAGLPLFLLAFSLMNNETWNYFRGLIKGKEH